MSYVDGFVVPVPQARLGDYKKMARLGRKVWMEHGALAYHECVADDAPMGKLTSFPRSVKLKDDEVVVFSWITYPSREVRDACNAKVMEDPRLQAVEDDMKEIMGMQRMFWGGFKPIVQE